MRILKSVLLILVLAVASSYVPCSGGQVYAADSEGAWDVRDITGIQSSYESGDTISGHASFRLCNPPSCPGCIQQILVGIVDEGGSTTTEIICVYNGIPKTCPTWTEGSFDFKITAPSTTGRYKLIATNDYKYERADAINLFPMNKSQKELKTITIKQEEVSWFHNVTMRITGWVQDFSSIFSKKVVVKFHISGTVNGDSFTQTGKITCDVRTGVDTVTGVFSKIPVGFHPFICGGCDKCNTCKWNGSVYDGGTNLDTVTHGNFDAISYLTIKDPNGTIIGEITSGPTRLRKVSKTLYTMDSVLNGYYNGPIDLVGFGDYSIPLHQQGPGRIIGRYTQQIFRSDGTSLTLTASRIYTYKGFYTISMAEMLPFDQVKRQDFKDVTLDRLTYSFKCTGAYTRVPATQNQ
jgi:hypothetical protein